MGESPAIVDFIATEGIKIPQAPLRKIDSLGTAKVIQELSEVQRELRQIRLDPPQLLDAMAGERETFYKNDQVNPWLLSRVTK